MASQHEFADATFIQTSTKADAPLTGSGMAVTLVTFL